MVQAILVLAAGASATSVSESMAGVEHCVSSRWGFSCFSRAGTRVGGFIQRNNVGNIAQLRKYGARGIMLSAGLVFGREVLRDTMALPGLFANGHVADITLASAVKQREQSRDPDGNGDVQADEAAIASRSDFL